MKEIVQHFFERGWAVLDFIDLSPILKTRDQLQKELTRISGFSIPLEEYHVLALDDARHIEIQTKMTQFFRQERLGREIIKAQMPLFQQIIGLDLLVQANPYLRMTRPHKPQDNIGYHRDTFYGGSPYEISVLIPYVDLEKEESLGVVSGTHVLSEALFPIKRIKNPDSEVMKGSVKHQLGFLYAPKLMGPEIESQAQQIPLKVGQALIFALSTVHGSVVNEGKVTRWSSDIRVLNALAPVDLSARPDYYETLCLSPLTECARQYEQANREEAHV